MELDGIDCLNRLVIFKPVTLLLLKYPIFGIVLVDSIKWQCLNYSIP